MIEWYTKDLWKAYIGWLSPRWASPRDEFDPKEWVDKLERGGFRVAVMHAKHHDGVCFFRSKYRKVQPERDFFGEFVTEAHKRGMYVVTYYSTVPDVWSCQENPEWSCIEMDGTPVGWGPSEVGLFGLCCINNPGYRAFLLGQLEEIERNYNTDGFWMDIFKYPSERCFCYHCRSKYFKDSGGKKLEDMWERDEVKLWHRDRFLELLKDIRKIATYDGVERVIVYNGAGTGPRTGYEELDKICNTFSNEAHSLAHKSFSSRLLAPSGRPFELYSPVSDTVLSWTFRPTELLILEAAATAAHGGSLLAGFDVKPSGHFSEYQMDELGKVASYLRERQEFLVDTTPVYDVGLLRGSKWAITLLRSQIPFGMLLPEATDLSPYRLVIIEEGFSTNELFMRNLEEYVANGGNILVENSAAGIKKYNGNGFTLSRLLGVECRGPTGFSTNYLGGLDRRIIHNLSGDPVRADGEAWKLELTTAEALAYYVYPIAEHSRERWLWTGPNPPRKEISRDPAITLNRFGDGRVIYMGCSSVKDEAPHRRGLFQLIRNLISLMVDDPLLKSETPPGVEVIVNCQHDRHIVHLINHYLDMTSLYDRRDNVPKLGNVSVWINEKRIGSVKKIIRVPDKQEIEVERDGCWVHLVAPELVIQEIFVLKH